MLQYLLNASAIWLISLVLFDVFLRRESYHGYNRFYLLFTFLLGALLPLWQWQGDSPVYTAALQRPVERVIAAKQTIVTAAAPAADVNLMQWIGIAYLAGALVALILLILDIVKLAAFYKVGVKSTEDGWRIIETDKEHAPFSFRNTLFVSNRRRYSDDEWKMILAHERRHTALQHFADVLLMQVGRIIFWFHPLVYLYNKRLLMLHEYQADNVSARQPRVYGQFLVEQALLQPAPTLSHSFNRSPIKNRIVMLTRRSSSIAKIKMLVFVPLAVICIACFSKSAFSQKPKKEGNVMVYNGNTIEFAPQKPVDTTIVIDPLTGKEQREIHNWANPPMKVNARTIYDYRDAEKPKIKAKDKSLADYMVRNLKPEFEKLADGEYNLIISEVVIDKNGKVVYYENNGIQKIGADVDEKETNKKPIIDKIEELLSDSKLVFEPATLNGQPVDYLISNTIGYTGGDIVVKDHKLQWTSIEEQ